jgi:hypothetical protein
MQIIRCKLFTYDCKWFKIIYLMTLKSSPSRPSPTCFPLNVLTVLGRTTSWALRSCREFDLIRAYSSIPKFSDCRSQRPDGLHVGSRRKHVSSRRWRRKREVGGPLLHWGRRHSLQGPFFHFFIALSPLTFQRNKNNIGRFFFLEVRSKDDRLS